MTEKTAAINDEWSSDEEEELTALPAADWAQGAQTGAEEAAAEIDRILGRRIRRERYTL